MGHSGVSILILAIMTLSLSLVGCPTTTQCTLTYTAGANGTITGTSPQTVNEGASGVAVTAVPDTGYHFVQWSDASTQNPRTDTNVTANISVTASFALNILRVDAASVALTPDGHTWATAYKDIQTAVDAVTPGDVSEV